MLQSWYQKTNLVPRAFSLAWGGTGNTSRCQGLFPSCPQAREKALGTRLSKNYPITGEHGGIIFATQLVTIATLRPAKNTLNFSFRRLYFKKGAAKFFLISNFNKQDKMQLLAKFKKILCMGFRATLNFRKSTEFFQTLPKVASCYAYQMLEL